MTKENSYIFLKLDSVWLRVWSAQLEPRQPCSQLVIHSADKLIMNLVSGLITLLRVNACVARYCTDRHCCLQTQGGAKYWIVRQYHDRLHWPAQKSHKLVWFAGKHRHQRWINAEYKNCTIALVVVWDLGTQRGCIPKPVQFGNLSNWSRLFKSFWAKKLLKGKQFPTSERSSFRSAAKTFPKLVVLFWNRFPFPESRDPKKAPFIPTPWSSATLTFLNCCTKRGLGGSDKSVPQRWGGYRNRSSIANTQGFYLKIGMFWTYSCISNTPTSQWNFMPYDNANDNF